MKVLQTHRPIVFLSVYLKRERFILKELVHMIVRLAHRSPWGSSVRLETQLGFLFCSLEAESCLLGECLCGLLRPLQALDWMRPTLIMEHNLLHSKSADINVHRTCKIPSRQHLDWCLTKQLGTTACQVDTYHEPSQRDRGVCLNKH